MADNAVQSVGKGPGNQTRVIVIMGGLIIVALVGVIIALVVSLNNRGGEQQAEAEPEQRAVFVTEENIDEVIEEMVEETPVPRGMFEMSMNMNWVFPDGASESTNAYVENAKSNNYDIYFDVMLAETGETIYSSPVLPIGSVIRNFALDTPLAAGTYECVCEYHQIDEQQRTLGTISVAVTVTVES